MAIAAMVLVVVAYAANFIAVRYSVQNGLTALDLAALRFGVAGLLLTPTFFRLGLRDLGGIGWLKGATLACLAGAPYMLLFFFGLSRAPASHGSVLNPGVVPSVVFLAMLALGRQSFSAARAVSLGLIVIGVVLVTRTSFSGDRSILIGDLLLLTSGISWGLFAVGVRIWDVTPIQSAAVVSVLSLMYLPFYLAFWYHGTSASIGHLVGQAIYQGVINSIVALYLVTYAVRKIGAQMTALFTPLIPVLTTLMAIPLLGEIPTTTQWMGIGIVVFGMISASMSQ
jgi:drug/metabolite transporter (DMT)-like permease